MATEAEAADVEAGRGDARMEEEEECRYSCATGLSEAAVSASHIPAFGVWTPALFHPSIRHTKTNRSISSDHRSPMRAADVTPPRLCTQTTASAIE